MTLLLINAMHRHIIYIYIYIYLIIRKTKELTCDQDNGSNKFLFTFKSFFMLDSEQHWKLISHPIC